MQNETDKFNGNYKMAFACAVAGGLTLLGLSLFAPALYSVPPLTATFAGAGAGVAGIFLADGINHLRSKNNNGSDNSDELKNNAVKTDENTKTASNHSKSNADNVSVDPDEFVPA